MIAYTKDFKLGLGLSVFCVFLLIYLIPRQVGPLSEADALMPALVTGFILLLSLLLMLKALRRPGGEKAVRAEEDTKRPGSGLALAGVVAIMAAYAWLLESTGFVLTSLAAMVGLFLLFGVRRWLPVAAITLGTLGGLYICFDLLLGAPLPLGALLENFLE